MTAFCSVVLLLYTNRIIKWQVMNRLSQTAPKAESGRPDSREWHREVRGMESCLKYPQGFSKGPGSALRYTICLQDSTQLGTRVWWAENRDLQSQSSPYWPTHGDSAPTLQCDNVKAKSTKEGGEQKGVQRRVWRQKRERSWREFALWGGMRVKKTMCVCVVSYRVCVGEMCMQGLVTGLLSDSGVNNVGSSLCVCERERETQGEREHSKVLGRCRAGHLCVWVAEGELSCVYGLLHDSQPARCSPVQKR